MAHVDKLIVHNVTFDKVGCGRFTADSICYNVRYLAKCIIDADPNAVFQLGHGGGTARSIALYLSQAFEHAEGISP